MTQLEQQFVNGSYYLRRNLKGTSFWLTCKRRGDSNGDLSENKCVSECVSRGTNVWANKVAYLFRVWLFSREDWQFLRDYLPGVLLTFQAMLTYHIIGEDFNLRWQRQRWIGRLSVEDRTGNQALRLKTMCWMSELEEVNLLMILQEYKRQSVICESLKNGMLVCHFPVIW